MAASRTRQDRKSTRLNSSHTVISYAVFCLKKKKNTLACGTPIHTLDMYEHSYHMDFGAKAADYVGIFMAAINWPAVRRAYDGVFFNDTATTEIYTLSLHDALPI